MAVKSKSDVKTTFEKGDRPTEAEFGDFIDSYVPIASDGAVGFMEVVSTATSISRPAETLTAIATAVQGGKTGIIDVQATADVTTHSSGVVGLQVLSAETTASAQGHMDLASGVVGQQIFEAATTASAQGHLSLSGIVAVSAASTVASTENFRTTRGDATGGAITRKLPAVASVPVGFMQTLVKVDSSTNIVNLAGDASETINAPGGARNVVALPSQFDRITVINNGASWDTIDHRLTFESTEQTITLGSGLSVSNPLGVKPRTATLFARNTTTEAGWAVGDEIVISTATEDVSTAGVSFGFDASSFYIAYNITALRSRNRGTGATGAFTASSWRWVIRAEL